MECGQIRGPGDHRAADSRSLKEFLDSSNRPDGTLRFHELQGFLFAIASSPETILPSEWLLLISNDEDVGFRDESEAQQILNCIMALYNEVNATVLERSDQLPRGCEFKEDIFANFDVKSSISQWSRGFMIGHDWLSELWENLPEEMDEECGATTMVLTFFSSQQLAEAYFEDGKPRRNKTGKRFEEFSATARELFPSALASYAHIGRTIFEVLIEKADIDEVLH
jgi:yecA family protein